MHSATSAPLASLARWTAFAGCLALPAWLWPHGAMLAYLAQTAALVVLALSYNLQLGTCGLLSFGHAAFAGLGAFAAAHWFNRYGCPLPLLPLVGGVAGAGFGLLFGALATRRSGTAFAMITLGLGECVAAAAWSMPDWFGGIGGLSIDRTQGMQWGGGPFGAQFGAQFGSPAHAYALIAAWCFASALAMRALTRTPLARLANAVRDNPARVAALGTAPRTVRLAMVVCASFFAGVAGTLTLIDVEIATADSVGMARSATVLIAAVIGGTASFFGPALGAAVLTCFSVAVAGVSRAWALYLGLLFVVVVIAAPRGLAGVAADVAHAFRRDARAGERRRVLCGAASVLCWGVAVACAAELGYAWRFAQDEGTRATLGAWRVDPASPFGWAVALAAAVAGTALWRVRAPRGADADADAGGADARAGSGAMNGAMNGSIGGAMGGAMGGTMGGTMNVTAVALIGVQKRFGAQTVLEHVDLSVAAGERHALIGPNGAGKSTLFNVIAGVERPTRGRVVLHGVELAGRGAVAASRLGIGRSFQQTSVFPRLSVFDNLRCAALHAPDVRRRWWNRLRESALVDRAAERVLREIGLDARRDVPAGTLGYAEQRALDLGIALASGASTLLLDEPTAGMSRAQAARMIDLIRRTTRGRTVLMIEHDMDTVFGFAERISVLVRGAIVATGAPDAIRADPAVRAAYLGTHAGTPVGGRAG
ncbi:ATP-binding cassette domain-containing protein [Burkholderia guangdongensis]|uniref:branched-chain amino acid ABC transporter ATP-binding protein/permease n=1 Tax=Burkholderia guangdongensis TaxID=1792500 RepID=UPI0015CD2B57|nr:branched-chain amino acid ABC transporter ATP-binding protein/permease [Burkholderia guangdongensis]